VTTMTTAEVKACMARFAEEAPIVAFEYGEGDGEMLVPILAEVDGMRAAFIVPMPPAGASPDLLAAFSARATASLIGRCPVCEAVAGIVGQGASTVTHEADCPVSNEALRAGVAAHWATGRNEPCPCDSGTKFKRCHGAGR
jgi:hypothetical protein